MIVRSWATAILLFLASTAFAAKETDPAKLAQTHGYVRVSLPQLQSPATFKLHNLKTNKNTGFKHQPEDGPYSFGAWVPEGDYEIADTPGQFVVKKGEMTELGAVLKIQLGGYEYVWLPLQHKEAAAEAEAAKTRLGALIGNVTAWQAPAPSMPIKSPVPASNQGLVIELLESYGRKVNKPPMAKQLREARTFETLIPLARQAVAPMVEEPGVDGQSNLYYGADFGQIRVRHADGTWGVVDSGTLDEIASVEGSDSRLVAGTRRGQILTSPDLGATWTLVKHLDRDEIVADIDRVGPRWFVIAPQSAGLADPWTLAGRVRVYSGVADDLSDLALLKELSIPKNTFGRLVGVAQPIVGQAQGTTYLINTMKELQALDTTSMTWRTLSAPHTINSFQISRDGTLLTINKIQGAFSKMSLSSDGGATWKQTSRPPYVISDAVFETPESGEAMRINLGAFANALEIYAYDPKIGDWRKTGETPAGCHVMLRDASYRQRFCLTTGGTILDQKEGGWAVEFANE
ncbi:hypothetical protein ACFPN2_22085 [Steroidobacter flavus]|uniref:BNR/Asp-box repeat protein n=1 Tax=Steroidobacter flavus TaxID=1842136 RepID=A0ABV8SYH4_9GAMM